MAEILTVTPQGCGVRRVETWMSNPAVPLNIPPFSGSRRPPPQSGTALAVAVFYILKASWVEGTRSLYLAKAVAATLGRNIGLHNPFNLVLKA